MLALESTEADEESSIQSVTIFGAENPVLEKQRTLAKPSSKSAKAKRTSAVESGEPERESYEAASSMKSSYTPARRDQMEPMENAPPEKPSQVPDSSTKFSEPASRQKELAPAHMSAENAPYLEVVLGVPMGISITPVSAKSADFASGAVACIESLDSPAAQNSGLTVGMVMVAGNLYLS